MTNHLYLQTHHVYGRYLLGNTQRNFSMVSRTCCIKGCNLF